MTHKTFSRPASTLLVWRINSYQWVATESLPTNRSLSLNQNEHFFFNRKYRSRFVVDIIVGCRINGVYLHVITNRRSMRTWNRHGRRGSILNSRRNVDEPRAITFSLRSACSTSKCRYINRNMKDFFSATRVMNSRPSSCTTVCRCILQTCRDFFFLKARLNNLLTQKSWEKLFSPTTYFKLEQFCFIAWQLLDRDWNWLFRLISINF